jgi:Undecaprenyl-phosphate glucose phosphotransferase
MIKQNQKHFNRFFILLDILMIIVSLHLAWYIRFRSGLIPLDSSFLPYNEYMSPLMYMIPLYLLLYNFFNLYKPRRMQGPFKELTNILKANVLGLGFMLSLLFILKNTHYSRYVLIIFAITNLLLNFVERSIIRYTIIHYRKQGYNLKHNLIIGFSHVSREYIKRIKAHPHWGYNIYGILDDQFKLNYTFNGIQVIGTTDTLDQLLKERFFDEVIIALSIEDYNKLEKIVNTCEKAGVHTRFIPDYYKYIPTQPYVEDLFGLPLISIRHIPLNDIVNRFIKRSIDIIGAITALILFSPFMLIAPIIIRIGSKGPALFKQTRVGLNQKHYTMYKYRTMKIISESEEQIAWTKKDDPRKTRLGQFMRKTSLDELPQLFNILKGDMSLIGPRPERPYFVERFKEEIPKYMIKHQVRPGMTGWAQIHGWRGDTSIKKRIEYDLYYIENWSLGLDIKILILTFIKGFLNKNAY